MSGGHGADLLTAIWKLGAEDDYMPTDLQAQLLDHLRVTLKVDEGTEVAGGELDLLAEGEVVIENKFHAKPANPEAVAKGAGLQGRRYGLALNSQLIIVVAARQVPAKSAVPDKTQIVTVRPISHSDRNRVEIRIDLPFGAPLPSSEKPASGKTDGEAKA